MSTYELLSVIGIKEVIAYRYVIHRVLVDEAGDIISLSLVHGAPHEYVFILTAMRGNDCVPPLDLASGEAFLDTEEPVAHDDAV